MRANCQFRLGARVDSGGFTLLELLVVIAVISVLASLLLPVLTRARAKSRTATCLNNKHQLALGWLMYADDHAGRLAINSGRTGVGGWNGSPNWADGVLFWDTDQMDTNVAYVAQDKWSGLARYVSHVAAVYRCPEDNFLSPAQRAAGFMQRSRSISMNWVLGDGRMDMSQLPTKHEARGPIDGSSFFLRIYDLTALAPCMTWVLLDEQADTLTSPSFWAGYNLGVTAWQQLPASYHDGGCTLAFADGHVEYKKWLVAQTRQPVRYIGWDFRSMPLAAGPDRRDFEWLAVRTLEPTALK